VFLVAEGSELVEGFPAKETVGFLIHIIGWRCWAWGGGVNACIAACIHPCIISDKQDHHEREGNFIDVGLLLRFCVPS